MAHAAQTRVAADRATRRSARPWSLGRARGVPTHSRRHSMLMIRGCSLSPCTMRCGALRLPVAGNVPPWMLRLVILAYPDLLPLRRRLLRRLPPRLSIMGISRDQMGGLELSRSENMSLTRMMMRGVIEVVMISPARCFTGPARLGWEMTSAPLLVGPPDGGVAIRRERPTYGRLDRSSPCPSDGHGTRDAWGVFPRLPLQVLRLRRCSGGIRRHRGVRLARTSGWLTRSAQRASGGPVRGGPAVPPSGVPAQRAWAGFSTVLDPSVMSPPRRTPTELRWGRFPPGSLMRASLRLLMPRCPTLAYFPKQTSGE